MSTTPPASSQLSPRLVQHARPARYASLFQWASQGMERQDKAIAGALLAAWTGLPFALWIAVGGLFIGAVAGVIGTAAIGGIASSVTHTAGFGVLGALAGAVIGAVGGLLLIYIYFATHLMQLASAIVAGAIVSVLVLVLLIWLEPVSMQLRGYREPSRREKARLGRLLADIAKRMGLAVVPTLWISDQQKPGAWAHMRGIVITRGLLGDYDASESPPRSDLDEMALAAVLAHELHHWDVADVVGTTMVAACFWPFVVIVNLISWIRERGEWLGILLWCFFWPVWLTSRFVVAPIMSAQMRKCEYEADARAAGLGDEYRLGLRRALDEFAIWERPRTGWEDVLAATHPPIEHRLERLEAAPASATTTSPSAN